VEPPDHHLTAQNRFPATCLTIGGSDSCGGAGIQADLAIFRQAGVRGCSAITALTAQNPHQIARIEPSSCPQLHAEIAAISDYYTVSAIKTGMLVDSAHITTIADTLARHLPATPLIIDPVMVASSGRRLLAEDGLHTLITRLIPLATLITPNLMEAALLLNGFGEKISVEEVITEAANAARTLATRFDCAVLLKGGHGEGQQLTDTLALPDGTLTCHHAPRISFTPDQAHGTGCRTAAAITAAIALGIPLADALPLAHRAAIDDE